MTKEELQIAYDKLEKFYRSYHYELPQYKKFNGRRFVENEDEYLKHIAAGSYMNGILHIFNGGTEPITEYCYTEEQFFEKIKELIQRYNL